MRLENRLARLSIKSDPCSAEGTFPEEGITYKTRGKGAAPYVLFYDPIRGSREAEEMTGMSAFSFRKIYGYNKVKMNTVINGNDYELIIPVDGTRTSTALPEMIYASQVMLSGYWADDNTFAVRFRWYETCFTKELLFRFEDNKCTVSERMVHGDDPDLKSDILYQTDDL